MSSQKEVGAGSVSPPDQEQASLALIALVSSGMSVAQARAKLAGKPVTPAPAVVAPEPEPKPVSVPIAADDEPEEAEEVIEIASLSDEDLAGYYEEATGKRPHHLMKRETIETAVREALA